MLAAPAAAQERNAGSGPAETATEKRASEQGRSAALPEEPLKILYFRRAERRADGAAEFGEGLVDAVTAINGREGGVNNVPVVLRQCDALPVDGATSLLDDSACGGEAKGALLAIVWPREPVERFVMAGEQAGLPLLAPVSRDILADGERLRWSFAPPVSEAGQAVALLQLVRQADANGEVASRIGLFHTTDAWGVGMRDTLITLADLGGVTLQTYSVRPGEAQDVVSTFRDFGGSPPERLIVWGNDGLSDTVLREAVKRDYPTARIVGGFADGAFETVQDLGMRAKGFRVAALAAFGSLDASTRTTVESGTPDEDAAPVSPLRMAGQLIGAFSIEALGAAQELAEARMPARADVRNALERVRLRPQRMRALDLAEPSAAIGLSCEDHAGALQPTLLQWDGERFVRLAAPEAKSVPLALIAARGDRAKRIVSEMGGKPAATPPCPQTDRAG
ncbi:ABC transporter substrate-binding protein [Notoacmeibacter marinus]|uniref:ABC transporter substrate-binding protein n=1 Tax=Notoacmeibacter marinus TaxID=1876515 RepID=UPI0013B06C2A|nr:ABC transporter substrate-binding protein [Notoacmeibacter marinus]